MILDEINLLKAEFLPNNKVCYTVAGIPQQMQEQYQEFGPMEHTRQVYIELSTLELLRVVLSQLYEPYKQLKKYIIGFTDHRVTIKAPATSITSGLRKHIYEDCTSSVIIDASLNTIEFDVWLPDFHTNVRIRW